MTVIVGGVDDVNAMLYGYQHPGTMQYLEQNINKLAGYVGGFGQTVSDAGRNFYESAMQTYNRFNGAEAMRAAALAMKKIGSAFQPNVIRPLTEITDLQTAPLTMQRWIMAEPTIRQLYHKQQCDGFSDSYVDMSPGLVGKDHYDWRRVHNGLVVEDEQDPDNFRVTFYLDDLPEGERELTLEEKEDVLTTWDAVKCFASRGKDDPTSPTGGMF